MDTSKIIKGVVNSGRYTVTAPIVKEDYGLYLKIEGLELPSTYEVDFSNDEHNGTSVTMIGNSDGVLIPSQFISTGKDIFAFLYHVGVDFGRTIYKFRIPNKVRPDRTDETPTPEEQSTIDQAISALNSAVTQTAQDVIDADASAQSASQSAENAHDSAVDAQNYAESAQTSANNASASAQASANSASASAQSASQSAQIKADVEDLADDAQASANSSGISARASGEFASQAQGFARQAESYANGASGYASDAQTSANTASIKASEASTSAQTASAKASEASQSATNASQSAQTAEQAKTDAQTAKTQAESARDTAVQAKTDAESARDEAQNLVDGISGKVEQIDSNTERIESLEDDRYKPYVVDTASGSIASFSDGADDIPLKSLVVDINPVQDLHGYDSPWVAGGGVNKLPPMVDGTYTGNGVTAVVKDGVATLSGTTTASGNALIIPLTSEFTITEGYVHLCNSAVNASLVPSFEDANNVSASSASWALSPANRIGTIPSNRVGKKWNRIRFYIGNGVTISGTFSPMACADNTARSYSPYENICPISGWTGCEVNASGKNLVDISRFATEYPNYCSFSNGVLTVTSNSALYSRGINVDIPQGSVLNWTITNGTLVNARLRIVYEDGTVRSHSSPIPLTVSKRITALRFDWGTGGTFTVSNFQAEFGSSATTYEPYTGRTIPISWADEAGTVYGGSLDVLSGVLRVYPYYASYNGETLTGKWISDRDVYVAGTTPTIGAQVVNIGAEGTEYQLEPHEVASLLGANNIFADTGDTEVEYRADTKLYIEKLTQPEEDDMIADSAISEGQFFMIGNSLYRALANIASGATITVGTNAQRVSLSDALNLVNA